MSGHHEAEQIKGRLKEATGTLTGNKDLEHEGQADRAAATVKEKAEKAADKIGEAVDKVIGKDR